MAVIIGMDPHKRSATIEVVDERGGVKHVGRYGTDKAGYAGMLNAGPTFGARVWAVEGSTASGNTSRTGWCTTGRRWRAVRARRANPCRHPSKIKLC